MAHKGITESFKGFESCPEWLKDTYRKSANYMCQLCNKHEQEVGKLTPHRITRGHKGGLYTVFSFSDKRNNIKVVCLNCHKKIHAGEFK